MNVTSILLGLIVTHLDDNLGVCIDCPTLVGNTLSGKVNNQKVEINIDFIANEVTGEVLDIVLYSDDVPVLNDVSIDRDDNDAADIYDELNNDESNLRDYLNEEDDDSEDYGHSL